ncbi:hypothetical protein CYLTODRAFT_397131 [Cylindrobasidium torrendii FP15055 ss-10]|uniref:Vacuolar ATPase assembly integral membrane protein VMA21 n=1 Tax=Cylindrobasidium torrendii FP15055 ss-10 TaxID=1314674 RepID=A0A0D7BB07_9AGAR|nr:hypothetical protein CYLTODRAFT_397131 [Cylindrobasidium torrendii FP15055 ss-10]
MEQSAPALLANQAASGGTLVKLVVFSVSLGVLPLSSYFISLNYIWDGNATFAAITAIVAANAVLVSYIVSSVYEDGSSSKKPAASATLDSKKDR